MSEGVCSQDTAYGPYSPDAKTVPAPSASKCCERRDGQYGCHRCSSMPIPGGSGSSAIVCVPTCHELNLAFPGENWELTGYTDCTNPNLPCADGGITYEGGTCAGICNRAVPTMTTATMEACCSFNGASPPANPLGVCGVQWCPNGSQCSSYVANFCSTFDPVTGLWPAACDNYFSNTSNGYGAAATVSLLAEKFLTIPYTGVKGSNPFAENYASSLCARFPGACTSQLPGGYCSTVSRDQLVSPTNQLLDANLITICGCMMAPTVSNYPFLADSVSTNCDSLCMIALKQGQFVNGEFQANNCLDSVCILNSVAISLINSTTGSVTIDQVCGSENTFSKCYISGLTISEINSQISGGTTVSQVCSECLSSSTGLPISCLGGGSSCSSNADCPVGESCGPNGICFENPSPSPSSGFISKIVDWIQQHELVAVGSTSALVLMVGIILIFLGTRRRR